MLMFASVSCDVGNITRLPTSCTVGVQYFIRNNQNLFRWLLKLLNTNYDKVLAKIFIIFTDRLLVMAARAL